MQREVAHLGGLGGEALQQAHDALAQILLQLCLPVQHRQLIGAAERGLPPVPA